VASTAWHDGRLCLRLAGAAAAVDAACAKISGELLGDEVAAPFWEGMREQTDPFFSGETPLWRLAVPATTEPLALQGDQLIEWNGAQRWWRSDLPAQVIRAAARASGGHATLFRSPNHSTASQSTAHDRAPVFTPLDAVQMKLHRNLKQAFDPYNIFSPGRMYSDF